MSDYQSRTRLSLTRAEATALLTLATEAEAGDMYELLDRNMREVQAALRAIAKLRRARDAAMQRDAAKAALKVERLHDTTTARCPNDCGEVTWAAGRYRCGSCGSEWPLEAIHDA